MRTAHAMFALVLAGCWAGCGDDDEAPPAPDVVTDVRALQDIVTEDPAITPLDEVDDAVADDLPARAAELIEVGALPAARRQVEIVDDVRMTTPDGRRLRRHLRTAYRDRVAALEAYRDALARGPVEDLALVDAMEALRVATEAVLEVDRSLSEVRPLAQPRAQKRAPTHDEDDGHDERDLGPASDDLEER